MKTSIKIHSRSMTSMVVAALVVLTCAAQRRLIIDSDFLHGIDIAAR